MKRRLLITGLLLLLVAFAWTAARNHVKKRPGVLFVSIHTLRAGHLSTYDAQPPAPGPRIR